MKKTVLLCVLVAISLVACAAPQKPLLPGNQYKAFANDWVVNKRCGMSGRISPDLSAFVEKVMAKTLTYYTYAADQLKLDVDAMNNNPSEVPTELCNSLAIKYEGVRQKESASQTQYVNPVRTMNCSTYFGQTRCTSY